MRKKTAQEIIEKIKKTLVSYEFMDRNRTSKKYFTRKRKLPFHSLVCFFLNSVKQTVQKELTGFINLISEHKNVSKSAFCQQRVKLKPEAFIELNNILIQEFYTENDTEKWQGFHLLSIDGSGLELPKSTEIRETFGVTPIGETATPVAKISTFYDVLNNIIIDAQMYPYRTSEYPLALKHLEHVREDDLIIFDRGFCGYWFFYYMLTRKINFVVRLQRSLGPTIGPFWKSEEKSKIIKISTYTPDAKKALKALGLEPKPFKIRLVKVILDNGEMEVLATSLFDEEKFPVSMFKELYFKRWRIEVNYDHLKNHIEIGNFTGYSVQAIRQDFYANMLIANLQSIIIREAQEDLNKKKIDNKRRYKINRNLSLGYMKNRIIKILTEEDNTNCMKELKKLFLIEPVPIRDGRSFPRNTNRAGRKYDINQKRAT